MNAVLSLGPISAFTTLQEVSAEEVAINDVHHMGMTNIIFVIILTDCLFDGGKLHYNIHNDKSTHSAVKQHSNFTQRGISHYLVFDGKTKN